MPNDFARSTGPAVAAFMSAGIAVLVLGIVQTATFLSKSFQEKVFELGKAWIPNADGIGPYSGKETLMLLAWVVSWVSLHAALRRRSPNVKAWFGAFLVILFVAVLLVWPPVWHFLKGE